jgi:hypothetical protein
MGKPAMRVYVEEVDKDWNPCPDPGKYPTRPPRSRPVAVVVRSRVNKPYEFTSRPSPCALRALSLSHKGRGREIDCDARRAASFPLRMT